MDSISFIFDNIMFSGDFIFYRSIGRCDLGGDYYLMIKSIEKILNSDTNYKTYPRHEKEYLINLLKCRYY